MDQGASEGMESDTREAIMRAVYRALCEHGYANLTTKRIADELGKSTALLHYYYESKEELLVAFLEYLLTQLDTKVADEAANPSEKLEILVDALLPESPAESEFGVAALEMKAQAPYVEPFRQQLQTNDDRITELIEEMIQEGIDTGHFADVDPARAAEHLRILVEGARTRSIVLDKPESVAVGRTTIEEYLEALRTEGDPG